MLRKMFVGVALASVFAIGCGPKAEKKDGGAAPAATEKKDGAPADAGAAPAAPAEEKKAG